MTFVSFVPLLYFIMFFISVLACTDYSANVKHVNKWTKMKMNELLL
jgi:hypothetical protein